MYNKGQGDGSLAMWQGSKETRERCKKKEREMRGIKKRLAAANNPVYINTT